MGQGTRGLYFAMKNEEPIRPFLRWPGGKSWLAETLSAVLKDRPRTYIEPFLGGGAYFLALAPQPARLSDLNADLIECYQQIKENPKAVWRDYSFHVSSHSPDYYDRLRKAVAASRVDAAGRFLYLNRACFNGIYRVNKAGQFNVPMGTPRFNAIDLDLLVKVSERLSSATIETCDFERPIDTAQRGDLLVLDPPYTSAHNRNGFVRYNEKIFSWSDQVRLASAARRAAQRGVAIFATNANHKDVRKLYESRDFQVIEHQRRSAVAAKPTARGNFSEIIITTDT